MNTIKTWIKAATALLVTVAGTASAQTTVNVSGSVFNATCTITTSATNVALPAVNSANLSSVGATAGSTPWSVTISGPTTSCNPNTMNVLFGGSNINAAGRMKNNGTAQFVDAQVINAANGVVDMSKGSGLQGTVPVSVTATAGTSSATQNYTIRYYATGAATAGTFTSSFTFTIEYS